MGVAAVTRWQVVRQTSHSPDEPVPSGRLGWLTGRSDALSELRAHRLANREQRSGVFYTSRPVTETDQSEAVQP